MSPQVQNTARVRFPADSHFFECQELQCRTSHSLCGPSKQTLVCVEWIRPDNVFLKVLDRRSLLNPHLQYLQTTPSPNGVAPLEQQQQQLRRFTGGRCHKLATDRQHFLWKHLQQKSTVQQLRVISLSKYRQRNFLKAWLLTVQTFLQTFHHLLF